MHWEYMWDVQEKKMKKLQNKGETQLHKKLPSQTHPEAVNGMKQRLKNCNKLAPAEPASYLQNHLQASRMQHKNSSHEMQLMHQNRANLHKLNKPVQQQAKREPAM